MAWTLCDWHAVVVYARLTRLGDWFDYPDELLYANDGYSHLTRVGGDDGD